MSRSPRGSADRNGQWPGHRRPRRFVAPRAGARIETASAATPERVPASSLPARERGSKHLYHDRAHWTAGVAPRAGARIETWQWDRCIPAAQGRSPRGSADRNATIREPGPAALRSLPARERGSKHHRSHRAAAHRLRRSPRGSADRNAFKVNGIANMPRVAPRAGARIETAKARHECPRRRRSRSPRGSADRNTFVDSQQVSTEQSLPARERGSKLARRRHASRRRACRSPRGSADRNAPDRRVVELRDRGRSPRGSADRNGRNRP